MTFVESIIKSSISMRFCYKHTWPCHEIYCLMIWTDKPSKTNAKQLKEDREKLGLSNGKGKAASKTPPSEPTNAYQKIEVHNYSSRRMDI